MPTTTTLTEQLNAGYLVSKKITGSSAAQYSVSTSTNTSSTTITPLSDSYTPAVADPWHPLISPGDFFLGTERYHLYGKKACKTLSDVTFSVFELAGVPIPGTISVLYAGLAYTDFFYAGTELHFKHRNPEEWSTFVSANYSNTEQAAWIDMGWLGKPTNTIAVSFHYYSWNGTTKTFDTNTITQNLTVRDDEVRRYYRIYDSTYGAQERTPNAAHSSYFNYQWYAPRFGPVVITDDLVENSDKREVSPEFRVDSVSGEVVFSSTNLFRNAAFEILNGSTPYEWNIIGSAVATTNSFPSEACYGRHYMQISTGGSIYQTVMVASSEAHTISFYARRGPGLGPLPSMKVVLNPIDVAGKYIDTVGTEVGTPYDDSVQTLTKTVSIGATTWTRYSVTFGSSNDFFTVDDGPLPKETFKVEVRFIPVANTVHLDAVQIETGYEAFPFIYLPGKTTIEYESDPTSNYEPAPLSAQPLPFRRDDVDLNPVESEMPNGFLCLLDDGGTTDFQLGKGGVGLYRSGVGPTGVLGRGILPYSKVSGISKLQPRQTFHLSGTPIEEDIPADTTVLTALSAIPIIPESSYLVDPGGNAEKILHVELGSTDTPTLVVLFQDQFGNPLYGKDCKITHVGTAGTSYRYYKTDRAGRAQYKYSRISGSAGTGAETVVFTLGSVSYTFTIDAI